MEFGTDGLRGRYPDTVHPSIAYAVGHAVGQLLGGTIAVARDTRLSGPILERAVIAGIQAAGAQALALGEMPTPALSVLVPQAGCTGGIMLTASHNPPEDNGLKVVGKDGKKLDRDQLNAIGSHIDALLPDAPVFTAPDAPSPTAAFAPYFDAIQRFIPPSKAFAGLRIVVDAANGAARHSAPLALSQLGAEVITLNDGDGAAINLGCGALHPENLAQQVQNIGADYGIALDGDGDRGILVCADGRILDGDDLLFLLSHRLPPNSTVVGTIMSNQGLEQALQARGFNFIRTPVGDAYVAAAMDQYGTELGGEPSGHILFSPHFPTADGLVSCMAAILSLKQGATLNWGRWPQIQGKAKVPRSAIHKVSEAVAALEAQGARVVVRPSGTEAVVRVMVEHQDAALAKAGVEQLLHLLSA